MNKCITFLLGLLIISSQPIIAAEDPDDPTNVKTPDEASKTVTSAEPSEVSTADKNSDNRNGRKRRRRSVTSEHKNFFNQTKKENR